MAGWNLESGRITDWNVSEDRYWSLVNFVLSPTGARKTNTYKFAFLKSILDNLLNYTERDDGSLITFYSLYEKFTENYWNLVVEKGLRQAKNNGKSEYTSLERILFQLIEKAPVLASMEFIAIDPKTKESLVNKVASICNRYVIGALYDDFGGCLYSFDKKGNGIVIAPRAFEFLLKYKLQIEKLNYYAWAKFLETINPEEKTNGLLNTLELAVPQRKNLTEYRKLLYEVHHEDRCFYCGRKLRDDFAVDHSIPWSFVKNDRLWNFVLSCRSCNSHKSNRLIPMSLIPTLEERNKEILRVDSPLVRHDMNSYTDDKFEKVWHYAEFCGIKEYEIKIAR